MSQFKGRKDIYDLFVHKYSRLPTEKDPDYLEMLRMSKYRIQDVPMHQPGKCANCGASKNDGRKYVDFGLIVDWYGTVYLCGLCLTDISSSAGLFDKLKQELEVEIAKGKVLQELADQGQRLHDVVVNTARELEEFYVKLYPPASNTNSDSPVDVGSGEATETESGSTKPKQRTTKSSDGSGSKDIPSLADVINLRI